jgi:acyl carrier protein
MQQQTIDEIKTLIAQNIDLGGNDIASFGAEDAIFGDTGLCLDSLDAVELIMLLQKKYGILIENMQQGREIFKTLGTLADYIEKNRKK